MRWIWMVPLGVFVAYSTHSLFKYTRMISNIFLSLIYTPDSDAPSSAMGEHVTILDSADHEIDALVIEAKKPRAIALYFHESGSNKASWEKYAFFLPLHGLHVIAPDLDPPREALENDRFIQWPNQREVERLEVVVRWARRAYGTQLPVVLFGVSKGANLALALAARDPFVSAVVADGLFSMREIFRDYIRKWAPILVRPNLFGDNYPEWIVHLFGALGYWNSQRLARRQFIDVEALLRSAHPPVLVIHGELDDYVSVTHQRWLARLASAKNFTHFQVPNAGHNQAVAVARQSYEKRVLDFLGTVLP